MPSRYKIQYPSILVGSTTSTSLHSDRPIVVTEMGIITFCLKNTLEEVTESLKEAKSRIEFDEEF